MNNQLSKSLAENVKQLNQRLGVDQSFDIIYKPLRYAGKDCAIYFVDGFVKDEVMNFIMTHLAELPPGTLDEKPLEKLMQRNVPYIEMDSTTDFETIVTSVLSGPVAFLIDGVAEAILIDTRTYPARGPQEPDLERVVRGSRDGFVETIIFNTSLTRRRVRDPSLRMEYLQVGKRSKTDICLAYIEDIVDLHILNQLRDQLKNLDIDGLPMAEKSLEEYLFKRYWNPYPMVRFTERPDVAASHLLEGHVLIYVDTSPSVMITPTTFFHHLQHAEEYRQKPMVGLFLRWVRFLAIFASLFLLPIWYLIATDPQLFPDWITFLHPKESAQIPLIIQILLAELGVEMLRMASVHTPSSLATAMGVIAGLILGEMAVNIGIFTPDVILYVAISVIGTFATPSYEMSLANRMARIGFLLMTALFGWPGLVIGILAWWISLSRIQNLNTSYLWPLFPWNSRALLDVMIRTPMPLKQRRPEVIGAGDPDRE